MDTPDNGFIHMIRRLGKGHIPRPFKIDLRSLATLTSYTPFSMSVYLCTWGAWVVLDWTAFNTLAYRVFLEYIPSEFAWGAFGIFFGSAAAVAMYGFGFNNWVSRLFWIGAGVFWIVLAGQFLIASPGNPGVIMYGFPALAMFLTYLVPAEYIKPIRDYRDTRTVS